MNNFDDLKLATEAMSGGKNTVLLDDVGMPSIMVVIPKMNNKDLVTGATDETHPAFVVDGVEKDKVYISKYLNIVQNNRAYSLPMQDPRANVVFNSALNYCKNKGEGWGLTPYSLWAAIALWCKKNKTQPRGNNNFGNDYTYKFEKGIATTVDSDGRTNRTATGSGPVTWYHDYTIAGICDMNGNVSEWNAGARIVEGVLQFIPYANCMEPEIDLKDTSNYWKTMSDSGCFAEIGDTNAIKLDYIEDKWAYITNDQNFTSQTNAARQCKFTNITYNSEYLDNNAAMFLKKMALLPETDDTDYGDDVFIANNGASECVLYRGGYWGHSGGAGVFFANLSNPRTSDLTSIGFRSAYYEL